MVGPSWMFFHHGKVVKEVLCSRRCKPFPASCQEDELLEAPRVPWTFVQIRNTGTALPGQERHALERLRLEEQRTWRDLLSFCSVIVFAAMLLLHGPFVWLVRWEVVLL